MVSTLSETRGKRNNNPLNIRNNKAYRWSGQIGVDNDGFCRFDNVISGLRAAIALVRTYNDRYDLHSVRDIISRWAPPTENNTERYIINVCHATGMNQFDDVYWRDKSCDTLLIAMAVIESRMVITHDMMQQARNILFK